MVNRYNNGEIKQEDASDMKSTLSSFDKYKSKLDKKRIEQYKSVSDLKTALHPFTSRDEEAKAVNQNDIDEGSTKVHSSPDFDFYHVHSMKAAQALGTDPKGNKLGWCTSHPDPNENMFDEYHEKAREEGSHFGIAHFHNEKFPYRRMGGIGVGEEIVDENNKRLHGDELMSFVKRHPGLNNIPTFTRSLAYRKALASHSGATKEDLDKSLNDEDPEVRAYAASNSNATKEHLDKALNDKHKLVRATAARNPNATKEHLDKALNDEDYFVRKEAVSNRNATKEHLDKALNDKDSNIRRLAAANPNATKEHLDKAFNDKDSRVRAYAARNRNATKEQLDKALNDKDSRVRAIAARNRKRRKIE